jgi:hypothetical protein
MAEHHKLPLLAILFRFFRQLLKEDFLKQNDPI